MNTMSLKNDMTKYCFYNTYGENCGDCIECYQNKCPVAVSMMTEDEKNFYNVKGAAREPAVTCKTCGYFFIPIGEKYARCNCKEKVKPCGREW